MRALPLTTPLLRSCDSLRGDGDISSARMLGLKSKGFADRQVQTPVLALSILAV